MPDKNTIHRVVFRSVWIHTLQTIV